MVLVILVVPFSCGAAEPTCKSCQLLLCFKEKAWQPQLTIFCQQWMDFECQPIFLLIYQLNGLLVLGTGEAILGLVHLYRDFFFCEFRFVLDYIMVKIGKCGMVE